MNQYLVFTGGVGLYALWAALVFTGHADSASLIYAIGTGLAALGTYKGITHLQGVPPNDPTIASAQQPPVSKPPPGPPTENA
jgi:hypothetical protein